MEAVSVWLAGAVTGAACVVIYTGIAAYMQQSVVLAQRDCRPVIMAQK
jgi:hypothetical protein